MLDWTTTQLYYGEALALETCRAVAVSAAVPELGRMAERQCADEERHSRAFRMYRERILGRGEPFVYGDCNSALRRCLETTPRVELKLLGLQVAGEWLFHRSLRQFHRACRWPVLGKLLRLVMRDEARHHGDGMESIRENLQSAAKLFSVEAQDFILQFCCSTTGEFPSLVFENAGFTAAQCRAIRSDYARNARRGSKFRPLVDRLRGQGLVPERLRLQYAALELV